MLLGNLDLLREEPLLFFLLIGITALALLIAITVHEASHALAASRLGDSTAKHLGRLSLNPLKHLDPVGTLMLFLVGFGWGKPVQHNPNGLKMSPKTATLLVAAAGPLSNFAAAALLAIPLKMGWVPYINPLSNIPAVIFRLQVQTPGEYLGLFLTGAVYLNVVLGVFNLLPLPPLDGYNVALGILPRDLSNTLAKINQYGLGPLFLLLFAIPFLTGYSPLSDIMGPPVVRLVRLFTGVG